MNTLISNGRCNHCSKPVKKAEGQRVYFHKECRTAGRKEARPK